MTGHLPDDHPRLARVGSGRRAGIGMLVALAAVGGAVALAIAERAPSEERPRPTSAADAPTPSATATATSHPSASITARSTDPPSALDRGTGWPPRPHPDSAAHFELRLLSYHAVLDRVVLDEVSMPAVGNEAHGRLPVPSVTWQTPAWVQIRFQSVIDRDEGRQLATVPLGLGSAEALGLPIGLASGEAVLARQHRGTRHWHYLIVLERPHPYSAPHEWVISARLNPAKAAVRAPAAQDVRFVQMAASPRHSIRASRTHGLSWLPGR